jgi:hypothetical protein
MKTNQLRPGRSPRSRILAARLERSLLLGHARMAHWLLDIGGNQLARKGHQLPPLLAAIRPAGPRKTDIIRERMVGRLLDAGADPDAGIGGMTPLLLAAGHGTVTIIDALLRAGAHPHAKDYQGRNALHHAAEGNQPAAVVVRLVTAGVDFDAEDLHSGFTPLGIYARHHNPGACRALLAAGADPNARINPLDISPREAAHSIESHTMVGILEERCQTALRKLGAGKPNRATPDQANEER